MMDLSVIIVSWNAKDFLLKCLASVIQDTDKYDTEIIVIDNASTDGSADAVTLQFPAVKLISNDSNLGFSRANNMGIRLSKGKYICLINSDVIVKERCMGQLINYMNNNDRIGLVGPRILDSCGKVQRSCMGFPTIWNTFCRSFALDSLFPKSKIFTGHLMKYWRHDSIKSVDVINGCFWMVRRDALDEVGMLDERFYIYGEDIDWCKRFRNAGWEVVFFPKAEAIHYGGASSANAPIRFFIEMNRAKLQYWQKYHGALKSWVFLNLILIHHLVRVCGQLLIYLIRPSKRELSSLKLKQNLFSIKWMIQNINYLLCHKHASE